MSGIFGTETRAYERGYHDARRQARVAAFGAIRRAVIFARGLDASANELNMTSMAAAVRRERARTIRSIIRAAIGSDKA